MKLHESVNQEDYLKYKTSYESNGGENIIRLAEALAENWDMEKFFDQALVETLNENPSLANMGGTEIVESLFVLSQLWEKGKELLEPNNRVLTTTEWRMLIASIADKVEASRQLAAQYKPRYAEEEALEGEVL